MSGTVQGHICSRDQDQGLVVETRPCSHGVYLLRQNLGKSIEIERGEGWRKKRKKEGKEKKMYWI